MWSRRESDSQGVIPSGLFWRRCTVKGPGFLCRKSPLPVSFPSRPSFAPLFAKRPHEPAGSLRRGRGPRPTHSARRQTRPHAYKPPTVAVAVTKTDTTSRPFPASLTLNPAGSETAPGFPVGWGGVGWGRGPARGQIGREGPRPPGARTRSPDPGSRHRLGDGAVVRASAKEPRSYHLPGGRKRRALRHSRARPSGEAEPLSSLPRA